MRRPHAQGSPASRTKAFMLRISTRCLAHARPVHHYDLYRLAGPSDLRGLDLEDSFTRGMSFSRPGVSSVLRLHSPAGHPSAAVTLLEWADRLGPRAPHHRLDLFLEAPEHCAPRSLHTGRPEMNSAVLLLVLSRLQITDGMTAKRLVRRRRQRTTPCTDSRGTCCCTRVGLDGVPLLQRWSALCSNPQTGLH